MTPFEERLTSELARLAATAKPRRSLRALEVQQVVVPVRAARGRSARRWPWLAVAAAVTLLLTGLAVAWARHDSGTPAGRPDGSTLQWSTAHASLAASTFLVDVGGESSSPPGIASEASSMFLSNSMEQMDIRWNGPNGEILLEWHFELDDLDWRLADVSATVDPDPMTPPVTLDVHGVGAPLAEAFIGDLDLTGHADDGTSVRLVVTGAELSAFNDRAADGSYLPTVTQTPVAPQLEPPPPLPADVRPTGVNLSPQEWMLLTMAGDILRRECMASAGYVYPATTDEQMVEAFGEWAPSPVLGIQSVAAAKQLGYRTVDAGILNGGSSGFTDEMSDEELEAFNRAIGGGGDGGGCYAQVASTLPEFDGMIAWSEVGDLGEDAAQDPRVIDALTAWRTCVDAAVGESAATPDELARRYAFSDGDTYEGVASDHEKAVAAADAICQQHADLGATFRIALADRERAAMGDRVDIYDNWARRLDELLHIAAEQLTQRDITLPPLDQA